MRTVTVMTRILLLLAGVLVAAPASAQTYVSAALSGDLTRSFETTTEGLPFDRLERDAIGWALRVGTAFGPRWGIELEFHKSGELEGGGGPIVYSQGVSWTSTRLTPPVT